MAKQTINIGSIANDGTGSTLRAAGDLVNDNFNEIYKNGIVATREGLNKHLTQYSDYTKWVDNHFNVQSYFNYDKDLKNIEQYILGLDFMQGHENNTWKDMFGQSWDDWNTCHRMLPNLVLSQPALSANTLNITVNTSNITQSHWESVAGPDWPKSLPPVALADTTLPHIQEEISRIFNEVQTVTVSRDNYNFLKVQLPQYQQTQKELNNLVDNKILVTGVPIKLQSLTEKKHIIKNFDQCVDWYNQWVTDNNYGKLYLIIRIYSCVHFHYSANPIASACFAQRHR